MDIIFAYIKGYSLEEALKYIVSMIDGYTLIIPIISGGSKLYAYFKNGQVAKGYIINERRKV